MEFSESSLVLSLKGILRVLGDIIEERGHLLGGHRQGDNIIKILYFHIYVSEEDRILWVMLFLILTMNFNMMEIPSSSIPISPPPSLVDSSVGGWLLASWHTCQDSRGPQEFRFRLRVNLRMIMPTLGSPINLRDLCAFLNLPCWEIHTRWDMFMWKHRW